MDRRKLKGIAEKLAIGAILGVAAAVLLYGLGRLPLRATWGNAASEQAAPAKASRPEPRTDRPSGVGNALGEGLLRKVERPAAVPKTGLIGVEDETFSAAYDELYDHRDDYYGREIELSGYVLHQDDLASGTFLVGKDLLWCCENDKYFIGFLAIAPADGTVPGADEEVYVRGVLEPAAYTNPENGQTFVVPAIRCSSVRKVQGLVRTVFPN